MNLLQLLARLYPWPVEVSDGLRRSLRALEWEVDAETVVSAGYGAGLVVGAVVTVAALVVPGGSLFVALLGVGFGLGTVHGVHSLPGLWATARQTRALGAAPDLVSRAVLSMRLSPTPERAAVFAAESGDGPLAASLWRHVWRAKHVGGTGLASFGEQWSESLPSLDRALSLVSAAGRAPANERERVLDRALSTVLDGTREQMRSFAANIRGPTTALYAFGVLLPTALVALVPAAGAAGVAVTPLSVVLCYNLGLPGVLVVASAWLLARRPVAFPPPDVADHPEAEASRWAVPAGCVAGIGAALAAAALLPAWGPPVAAVGIGSGLTLWLRYRPVVAVYGRIREAEQGLSDALSLAGRRIADGQSVENAIAETAAELDGPMGATLAAGARRQRTLQVSVREAFLGRHGALETLPSPRIRGSVSLLAVAASEGRPAGEAILALADHVENLQRIEQEARHELAYVCRTLASTATLFGPLVAGATVALASGMSQDAFPGNTQSLGWLGGPVGVYVLVLAVVLTVLSTGLTRGIDRPLVGHRVGRALVGATTAYLSVYLLVGTIV